MTTGQQATSKPIVSSRFFTSGMLAFSFTTLASIILVIWSWQLWRANLNIPLMYGQPDLTFESGLVKSLADNGWYLQNPYLGAPGHQQLYDFPMADTLQCLVLKLLVVFFSPGLALNLYFLLGFVLAAWSALLIFHKLGIAYAPAVVGSLLFAFAPYHFYHSEPHLLLSSYFFVPPMTLVLLWVLRGEPVTHIADDYYLRPRRRLTTVGRWSMTICFLVGCMGVYYAFFAVCLLAFAGLYSVVDERRFDRVRWASILAGTISLSVFCNILPTVLYICRYGRNLSTAARFPIESEVFSLRLIQLLVPRAGHRVPFLSHIQAIYAMQSPYPISESNRTSLGMIGGIGFCLLLFFLLAGVPKIANRRLLKGTALLAIAALLVGTAGGLGTIFAYVVSPEIRVYSRIAIYIEFFALLAVVVLLDEWRRAHVKSWRAHIIYWCVLAVLLFGGILDQSSPADVPSYAAEQQTYLRDEAFVRRIEATLPAGAMIFQLPYMSFPEHGPINRMLDYAPLTGYLHSHKLRWSYGAIKGRNTAALIEAIAAEPVDRMVRNLAVRGFSGIYIDRFGYVDNGAVIDQQLKRVLAEEPIVSSDGRFECFDLRAFAKVTRDDHRAESVTTYWKDGCWGQESAGQDSWHWCRSEADLELKAASTTPVAVQIEAQLGNAESSPAEVVVSGPGFEQTIKTPAGGQLASFRRTIQVRGTELIHFVSTAKPIQPPQDPRQLVFEIRNFRTTDPGSQDGQVEAQWGQGCYAPERQGNAEWNWCRSEGNLTITSPLRQPVSAKIRMLITTGDSAPSIMRIEGPGFKQSLHLSGPMLFSRSVTIPPGTSVWKFTSNAKRLNAPGDNRTLIFRIDNLHITATHSLPAADGGR